MVSHRTSLLAACLVALAGCGGAPRATAAVPPATEPVVAEPAPAASRTMSERELLDVRAIAAVLRASGFSVEVVNDKHVLVHSDGEREGRYLVTPHAAQELIHITKMYVLHHAAERRAELMELCNEVNRSGIVKTYIDEDGDLAIEAYLRVYGPMPARAVVRFARVFHVRADDAAQPFLELAPSEGEEANEPGFGDGTP